MKTSVWSVTLFLTSLTSLSSLFTIGCEKTDSAAAAGAAGQSTAIVECPLSCDVYRSQTNSYCYKGCEISGAWGGAGGASGHGGAAGSSPGGAGGTGGMTSGSTTIVGQSLWVPATERVVAEDAGGGYEVSPLYSQAACKDKGANTFTLAVATRELSWAYCGRQVPESDTTTPASWLTGQRTLSDAEFNQLKTDVSQALVVAKGSCGADKPTFRVTVTAGGVSQLYNDVFYSCALPAPYTDGIDAILTTARTLAKK